MTPIWQSILTQIPLLAIAGYILQQLFEKSLNKQTVTLEAKLSLINEHTLRLKTEEREASLELNKKIRDWYGYLSTYNIPTNPINNVEDVNVLISNINSRKYECDIAYSNLGMFIREQYFIELINKLNDKVTQYYSMLLLEVYKCLKIEVDMLRTVSENLDEREEDYNFRKEVNKKIGESWTEFQKKAIPVRRDINQLFELWASYANKRFNEIKPI